MNTPQQNNKKLTDRRQYYGDKAISITLNGIYYRLLQYNSLLNSYA